MSEISVPDLDQLDAAALRALARQLMGEIQERDHILHQTRTVVERQAHDIQYKESKRPGDGSKIGRLPPYIRALITR